MYTVLYFYVKKSVISANEYRILPRVPQKASIIGMRSCQRWLGGVDGT
jgi:hypothetical protein